MPVRLTKKAPACEPNSNNVWNGPAENGRKVIVNLQKAPAASNKPQLFVSAKAPDIENSISSIGYRNELWCAGGLLHCWGKIDGCWGNVQYCLDGPSAGQSYHHEARTVSKLQIGGFG